MSDTPSEPRAESTGGIPALPEELKILREQLVERLRETETAYKKVAEDAASAAIARDALEHSKSDGLALLEDMRQLRVRTAEQLQAIETIRKKADDDATYAYQAKINAEEHSKAAAVSKGSAEADINSISTNKKNFEELIANATVGKATLEADLKIIAENRKTTELVAQTLRESSEATAVRAQKIDEAKRSAETILAEIERLRDSSQQLKAKSEAAQTAIEATGSQITSSGSRIDGLLGGASQNSQELSSILKKAKVDRDDLAMIIEHLQKSDANSVKYEKHVEELCKELQNLIAKTESFLPSATSAGLAHSFNSQKARFAEPQRRWLRTFVWCIVGLIVVAAPSFVNAVIAQYAGSSVEAKWDDIFRGMALRLPIVVPLVWLAIYAGRNYMMSIRLEEDYAYKEAISRAFEGYKREMEKIAAGDAANPTPLTKLCLNVLTALAERPGRIYDGDQKDITILNEVGEAVDNRPGFLRQKTIAS